VEITEAIGPDRWVAGSPGPLSFRARDPLSGKPCAGVGDFGLLFVLVPGSWHHWFVPKESSGGLYTVEFVPPRAGRYDVFLRSAALRLETARLGMLSVSPNAVATTGLGPAPSPLVGIATQANLP
jgi:hypothetical protein